MQLWQFSKRDSIILIGIVALLVWLLLPGVLTLQTSFTGNFYVGIPKRLTLANWLGVDWSKMLMWIKNTMIVMIPAIVVSVLVSAMAGFGFAKYKYPGSNILFLLVVICMAIPSTLLFLPRFMIALNLNLYNSYAGMIAPVLVSPVGVFFARQFYLSMEDEIIEAAEMDGAGRLRIFWSIILPMSKPLITVLVIFAFGAVWGDLLWQWLIAKDPELFTMTVGLATVIQRYSVDLISIPPGTTRAGLNTVISTVVGLPPLIVFAALSKYFVEGLKI